MGRFAPGGLWQTTRGLATASSGSYCSEGVAVAGRIIERATGESLPAFAQENLFTPLGIRAGDVRWNYTLSSSNAATFAQLYLRPRDMLKLGILFQQHGKWNGRQLVSRDWVARSTGQWSTVGDQKYGYFWWHQWVMAASPDGPRRVDMIVATGKRRPEDLPGSVARAGRRFPWRQL